MNIKFLVSVIFCLCLAGAATGQVQLGVKTFYGVNYGGKTVKEYVSLAPLKISQIAYEGSQSRRGLGISLYSSSDKLFFMADGLYSKSGRKFALQSTNYTRTPLDPALEYETSETNLRVVAMGGVKIKNFKLGAGPEFSKVLDNSEDLSQLNEVTTTDSNFQSGFNFLIGYEFGKHVHLDLRHSYIFQDVTNEFKYEGVPMEMKSNQKYVELSLGLYF